MRCDIISPIWNQQERTERFVESVARHTRHPYRLILVDNGSEEPTRRYLESLTRDARLSVKLIRNGENLGNIKAVNQGIRASDAPYVCIQDNDTIVTDGWLSEMTGICEKDPGVGIVNPSSNASGWPPGKSQSIDEYAAWLRKEWSGAYSEMATAVGYSFLITRRLIEAIGLWDEIFGMGYYEDRDYSKRAIRAGFTIAYAKGAYVYHEEHSSFRARPEWLELQERNRAIYESRYGRPKRYLYMLSSPNEGLAHRVLLDAYEKARNNDFVWIFVNERCFPFDVVDHSNIDVFPLPPFGWRAQALFKILLRKKKFDRIFCDDPGTERWLARLSGFHGAGISNLGRTAESAPEIQVAGVEPG